MQKLIIFVVLFWGCNCVNAQVITGIVCDNDTQEPVPYAYVYLDRTSINTLTDTLGQFKLDAKTVINAKLVIQHMSYHPLIIERPFDKLPDTLYIKEKLSLLSQVVITAPVDRFSRNQKMKAFREQFLGMTNAGKSCVILNEDDIHLAYNMKTRRLTASADVPVIVMNHNLGYKIVFTLLNFWAEYRSISLNSKNLWKTFYAVTSSFTDLNLNNKKIKRQRDEVYKSSSNYFFKSFINNSLETNGFDMYNKGIQFDPGQYFTVLDDALSLKKIGILPNTDINRSQEFSEEEPAAVISVYYRIATKSEIHFLTNSFLVDRYGNIDGADKVVFTGQMGDSRAGDMLPMEYEP